MPCHQKRCNTHCNNTLQNTATYYLRAPTATNQVKQPVERHTNSKCSAVKRPIATQHLDNFELPVSVLQGVAIVALSSEVSKVPVLLNTLTIWNHPHLCYGVLQCVAV